MAVLFKQDFEDGTWGAWQVQQFAAGRAKVVTGSRATVGGPAAARWGSYYFESEVHSGDDVLGGERCEILLGGFNMGVTGADQWFSWSVFMPTTLPISSRTGLIAGQFHHTYDFKQSDQFGVSPNLAQLPFGSSADPHFWIGVNGGPAVSAGQDVNSTYSKAFDLGSLVNWQGEWVDVLLHVVWEDTLTGTFELWLKRASQTTFTKYVSQVGNIANKVTGYVAYIKLGQNRIQDSGLGIGYCWYDNFLAGDTRADVDIFSTSPSIPDAPGTPYQIGQPKVVAGGSFLGDIADYKRGSTDTRFVVPADASTVAAGYEYAHGGSVDTHKRMVVYAVSGGQPTGLIAVSQPVTVTAAQADGWVTYPFSPSFDLSGYRGQQILIGTITDGDAATWRTAVTGAQFLRLDSYASGPTDPWASSVGGGSTGQYDNEFAIALVYTPSSSTDTIPPTIVSAAASGPQLTLVASEALDPSSDPDPSAFVVNINGAAWMPLDTVAVSGLNVILTLPFYLASDDVVTVAYIAPAVTPLRDLAGNTLASFTARPVVNTSVPLRVRQVVARVGGALRVLNPAARVAGLGGGGI